LVKSALKRELRREAGENRLAAAPNWGMLGRMRYVIAAILIAAGALLIYSGQRRSGSIAGMAERTRKEIADAFDGRTRQPNYIVYYTGGALLIAGGAWFALRK
jgi:hypothetical protein